ncbi:hypothetical protein ACFYXD_37415 [Streptomyces platensis]|uniref:hypothetical protein n=1 Tax=Streptomyces platensis TaxID=58346 RepID=UPI0036A5DCA1
MRKTRNAAIIALTALALTTTSTMPASASTRTIKTTGAKLKFHSKGDRFVLYDTACDNHEIYVEWNVGTFGPIEEHFSGGCHKHRTFKHKWKKNATVRYHLCRNVQWGSDNCTVYYKNNAGR